MKQSESELKSRLVMRLSEITGKKPERLVDEDGDVQWKDSPFGIWARTSSRVPDGKLFVVVLAVPLLEVPASDRLAGLMSGALNGAGAEWKISRGAIHIFHNCLDSVLDNVDDLKRELALVAAMGKAVVATVQPVLGGFTAEQQRVLKGWRGRDERIEADMLAIATQTGGTLVVEESPLVARHGWNPRIESLPALVVEERVRGGWANRFATVGGDGVLRLRCTMPAPRDGLAGHLFTVARAEAAQAREWFRRLGGHDPQELVTLDDLRSLEGRPWVELNAALRDLPHEDGESWLAAAED